MIQWHICEKRLKAFPVFFFRDDDKGILHGRHIKSLAGCCHRDQNIVIISDCRCRYLLPSQTRINDILVDLIGNHHHPVPFADIQKASQFFLCPYPSYRIVGITQNVQFHIMFPDILLKPFEINFIIVIRSFQFTLDQLSLPTVIDRIHKRVIDWRGDHHTISRSGKYPNRPMNRRHHARRHTDPFRFHCITMLLLLPTGNCFKVRRRRLKISQRLPYILF